MKLISNEVFQKGRVNPLTNRLRPKRGLKETFMLDMKKLSQTMNILKENVNLNERLKQISEEVNL